MFVHKPMPNAIYHLSHMGISVFCTLLSNYIIALKSLKAILHRSVLFHLYLSRYHPLRSRYLFYKGDLAKRAAPVKAVIMRTWYGERWMKNRPDLKHLLTVHLTVSSETCNNNHKVARYIQSMPQTQSEAWNTSNISFLKASGIRPEMSYIEPFTHFLLLWGWC